MRRAAQEREVRQAVELGVRGEHGAAEKAEIPHKYTVSSRFPEEPSKKGFRR